jgi:hypothetical protein
MRFPGDVTTHSQSFRRLAIARTFSPAVFSSWGSRAGPRLPMSLLHKDEWEIFAGVVVAGLAAGGAAWLLLRKRPSAEEIERSRRQFLVQSGRIVDGMLLDVYNVDAEGRSLTMLLFNYRIGGVDYECSQDITSMLGLVNVSKVRAGFPCSVRYQPGNPQNSIVFAEGWTGLREGLFQLPSFEGSDPLDTSHLTPGA